jgi:hypothetical protein
MCAPSTRDTSFLTLYLICATLLHIANTELMHAAEHDCFGETDYTTSFDLYASSTRCRDSGDFPIYGRPGAMFVIAV